MNKNSDGAANIGTQGFYCILRYNMKGGVPIPIVVEHEAPSFCYRSCYRSYSCVKSNALGAVDSLNLLKLIRKSTPANTPYGLRYGHVFQMAQAILWVLGIKLEPGDMEASKLTVSYFSIVNNIKRVNLANTNFGLNVAPIRKMIIWPMPQKTVKYLLQATKKDWNCS